MDQAIWNGFVTERDRAVMQASGFGARMGFGKRPALLVIDVSFAFCGDKREPILEAIKKWRTSCGEDAWDALPAIKRLIETARGREVPVIYTTGRGRADKWDAGSWGWKKSAATEGPKARETNRDGNEIMPQIAPGPRDIVVYKQKPSGFHGSTLPDYLTLLGCDSVIVTGTTTSGCVRATVVDAFSANYRVAVVADACFDRLQSSHALSLVDMNMKYADVVTSEETVAHLESVPQGQYQLPEGRP